jgi:dienelactone hydrolase
MLKIRATLSRRSAMRGFAGLSAAVLAGPLPAIAQDVGALEYPDPAARYLKRLYDEKTQRFAFRDDYPGGFANWRNDARAELALRLGLERIAASAGSHRPVVELGEPIDMGDYTRQQATVETEPEVRMPFWLLKPKSKGPWPIGVFPHGHSSTGHDTTAGVFATEAQRTRALAEDRDVAVQAAKRGILAIAPTVRGLSGGIVPDLRGRHGKLDCRAQAIHSILAGRTAIGERVWDLSRILDWAIALPEVQPGKVLSMGNSGGGMVTIFAAAIDQRITVAVPSCSFAPTTSTSGYIFHCDCNTVPGLTDLGGLTNVAALIAPRYLLTVNGVKDKLHSPAAIEAAAAQVRKVYAAAGHPERYEHKWGSQGHRFYKDLMWPFIDDAFAS